MSTVQHKNPNNSLALDYARESLKFPERDATSEIIDIHTHLRGPATTAFYEQMARKYNITLTYSMTPLEDIPAVRDRLGGTVRFIAFPDMLDVMSEGRVRITDWKRSIDQFHAEGARMIKFWAGPRGAEYGTTDEDKGRFKLNAPHRIEAARHAAKLGMCTMVHVGDPDFWFAKRYTDPALYGTKPAQYEPLREYLAEFSAPCIAAHMGGWPENLEFLHDLLEKNPNLYLDMSATKWMVRELSKHNEESLVQFLTTWKGRVLFGSDIVLNDEMLASNSADEIKELVGSRYWAYRTMLETSYQGESPIHDPDTDNGVSVIKGLQLPPDLLRSLYHDAAFDLLEPIYNPTDGQVEALPDGSGEPKEKQRRRLVTSV